MPPCVGAAIPRLTLGSNRLCVLQFTTDAHWRGQSLASWMHMQRFGILGGIAHDNMLRYIFSQPTKINQSCWAHNDVLSAARTDRHTRTHTSPSSHCALAGHHWLGLQCTSSTASSRSRSSTRHCRASSSYSLPAAHRRCCFTRAPPPRLRGAPRTVLVTRIGRRTWGRGSMSN
jgi:hypothetical protein